MGFTGKYASISKQKVKNFSFLNNNHGSERKKLSEGRNKVQF